MRSDTFTFEADDGAGLFVYRWLPDEGAPRLGVVHIVHGMAEHAGRYARLAESLTAAGWAVYAGDLRGHGKTARSTGDLGFFAADGGFLRVVRDQEQLIQLEKRESPDLPLVILGHSMGSYLAQRLLMQRGRDVQGAVLSGTSGKPNAIAAAGRTLARVEKKRLGPRGRSALLMRLSFGAFNDAFKPTRTAYDWLSRDPAEVDRYAADRRCGFPVTASLWVDLLDAMAEISKPEMHARIPKDLPVYIFAGSEDPVGERSKSVLQLASALRAAGLRRVEHRIYPGGRHEMLNETNRDEVVRDLLAWLTAAVIGEARAA
ncbi:MAG TPA: alpha/beta hydrolase [Candidatus Nanopelagicales bacterium]|nr:alpha/beta hydrolase [Candidatus Nanopelagicales bacterium]